MVPGDEVTDNHVVVLLVGTGASGLDKVCKLEKAFHHVLLGVYIMSS